MMPSASTSVSNSTPVASLPVVNASSSATKSLEQYAQQLLADNKIAFPFGSTNLGNSKTSLDQFNFILF
ncbi:hypothetical protein Rin_00022120 [Candidatus Regiella insecticola 5.15]|uniref:Uncharacterized protein n=1 Tax=Candidatus Regiella insecticola 5.15 TaxID=1005043 RepID=G2H2B3_9ENTR|nr:hypothetical protein [Candidatus Regiella insecticola]EGY27867.1 hypothetical protein Rin_00022120 [Candidatus Regiella insecticola 5.15]